MISQQARVKRMENIIENLPFLIKSNLHTSPAVSSLISNAVIGDYPIDIEEYQNALEDDGAFNDFVKSRIKPNHFLDIGKMVYVAGYSATAEIKRMIDHEMKSVSEDNFSDGKVLFETMIFGANDE